MKTLVELARECYWRLCPHAPKDLDLEKSTTMRAFIEGASVFDAERDRYKAALKYVVEQIGPRLSKRQLDEMNDILVKDIL